MKYTVFVMKVFSGPVSFCQDIVVFLVFFFIQVLELQQQLTSVELQLHEEEVLVQKINSLERDNGDLSDSLSALREKQHEEKTTR